MPFVLNSVVLGSDRSDSSKAAGRYAVERLSSNGHISSVFVVSPWLESAVAALQVEPENLSAHWDDKAEFLGLENAPSSAEVSHRLAHGKPFSVLIAEADTIGADAIVIGKHGHHGGYGFGFGPVSRRLLHRSQRPVVVVPDDAPEGDQRLVAAIDLSSESLDILNWIADHAEEGTAVDVVTVVEPTVWLTASDPYGFGRKPEAPSDSQRLETATRKMSKLLDQSKLENATSQVLVADVTQAILDASEGASVLVVGAHGEGHEHHHHILGSVADHVAHRAHIPVVVVPSSSIES